jgi:hypothetical protein
MTIERATEVQSHVVYPIPLRDGEVVVRIAGLPDDLSQEEAKRIAAVILALAAQEPKDKP